MVEIEEIRVLGVAKVYSGGYKVNLPSRVREILDLKEGDEIVFYLNERGELVVRKNAPRFRLR